MPQTRGKAQPSLAPLTARARGHHSGIPPPNLKAPHSATGIIAVTPTLSLGGDVVHRGDFHLTLKPH